MKYIYISSFIKDNVFSFVGILVLNLKAIILMPIIIKSLGVEIYGSYVLLVSSLSIIYGVSSLGVGLSAKRYLPSAPSEEDRQKLFLPQFYFGLISILIVSGLMVQFNVQIKLHLFNDEIEYSPYLLPGYLIAYFFYSQGVDFFRYTSRIKYTVIGSTIYPYIHIGIILYLLYSASIININTLVISEATAAFIIGVICFIKILTEIKLRWVFFKLKELRTEINLGFPLTIKVMIDFIIAASDRFMIAAFISTSAVGYYNPAYLLGSLIMIIPKASSLVIPQLMSKAIDDGDQDSAEVMVSLSIKMFLFIAIPFVFGSMLLSKFLLILLTNAEVAHGSYILTPIVAIGSIFFGLTYILSNVLFVRLRTDVELKANLYAAFTNLIFNIVLLYYFKSLIVPAIATVLSYAVAFLYSHQKVTRTWTINYDINFIIKTCFSSLGMYGSLIFFVPYLEQSGSLLLAALFIMIACCLYGGFLYVFKAITRSEIEQIKTLIRKKSG